FSGVPGKRVDSIVCMASTILDCWLGASAPSIFATSWFDLALSGSNAARPRLLSDSRLRRASCCEDSRRIHPPLVKCAQDAAQVSGIQFKFFAQFRSCGLLAVGEFVEHADFTQVKRT